MSDHLKQLRELSDMKNAGIISEAEFDAQKTEILKLLSSQRAQNTEHSTNPPQSESTATHKQPFSGDTQASISPVTSSGTDQFSGGTQMGMMEGMSIGSYTVIGLVGQGGMGTVYRGRHHIPEVAKERGDVALKMILPTSEFCRP